MEPDARELLDQLLTDAPPLLATRSPAVRRLTLRGYALDHPAVADAVATWLATSREAPTPARCPVPWALLEAWYGTAMARKAALDAREQP